MKEGWVCVLRAVYMYVCIHVCTCRWFGGTYVPTWRAKERMKESMRRTKTPGGM